MLNNRLEDELIVCCDRTHLNQEEILRIQSLVQKNIDWKYLIKMAQHHGVMPLLYKSLSIACPKAVPAMVMETLQKNYQANGQRNLFMAGELIKLLHLFDSNGIPAVPFKGTALTASVYGNLALRQFSDLDILVQKQDVLKARDLLVSSGYTQEVEFKEAHAEALLKYQYELPFAHKNRKIFVELQWELVPRYLNYDLLYIKKRSLSILFPYLTDSKNPYPEFFSFLLCEYKRLRLFIQRLQDI